MTRRLLGYVVKLPDGRWLTEDAVGQGYGTSDKAGRAIYKTARLAAIAQRATHDLAIVLPLFAVRKPKPAPVVVLCEWVCSLEAEEPVIRPAPVVAAEGRYACLVEAEGGQRFFREFKGKDLVEVGARGEAEEATRPAWLPTTARDGNVVRILADGEHEAAVAAAVERGRARGFGAAQALARSTANALRVESQPGALAVVKALDEAAKGQDK